MAELTIAVPALLFLVGRFAIDVAAVLTGLWLWNHWPFPATRPNQVG